MTVFQDERNTVEGTRMVHPVGIYSCEALINQRQQDLLLINYSVLTNSAAAVIPSINKAQPIFLTGGAIKT